MCGQDQRTPPPAEPVVTPETVSKGPLTWYGRMDVRIRGRGGDVRNICVPMPDKYVREDSSVLEWLSRPGALPLPQASSPPTKQLLLF